MQVKVDVKCMQTNLVGPRGPSLLYFPFVHSFGLFSFFSLSLFTFLPFYNYLKLSCVLGL